jgi:predicted 2-oxoglutarate/Fe(II)-dependent dioxygenase YbiX
LSFLRYGQGNFFRPHCDAQLDLPDGRKSRLTIQIYLGEDGVEGGATRIMDTSTKYFDVEPRKGRVLIFQQRGIYHSGEEVTKGVKYAVRSDILFRQTVDEQE